MAVFEWAAAASLPGGLLDVMGTLLMGAGDGGALLARQAANRASTQAYGINRQLSSHLQIHTDEQTYKQ